MARPWRNCRASIALADEINRRWPGRDRASDGTIGDAAHAARTSDHNPWVVVDGVGVVRARDVDKDGIDAAWLCEHLRGLGAAGDRRLAGGGYLIFNRRITRPDFSGWRVYTGSNPHTSHVHVSFSLDRAGFDSAAAWGVNVPPAVPPLAVAAAPAVAPIRSISPEDVMYIKCQPDPNGPVWMALLAGPMFVGLGTKGERDSAEGAIARGAVVQWVEPSTWFELDRRSHALCDNPRPVVVQQGPMTGTPVPVASEKGTS